MQTVFCDSCKNAIDLNTLKRTKITEQISACPNGMYPKTWRFATFKCKCGKSSTSSIRTID